MQNREDVGVKVDCASRCSKGVLVYLVQGRDGRWNRKLGMPAYAEP